MDNAQQLSLLFFVDISDGHSFRNMLGIVKSEIDQATMIFSPTMIEISFQNRSKRAIHQIKIDVKELTRYEYNICDENGNLIDEFPVTFNTAQMFNCIKVGRKDGIRMYMLPDDTKINVQPILANNKDLNSMGASFVNVINTEPVKFDLSSNLFDSEPNIRVPAKVFSQHCSSATSLKCSSLCIIGEKDGITFKGMTPNNSEAFVQKCVNTKSTPIQNDFSKPGNIDEIDKLLGNLKLSKPAGTIPNLTLNIVDNGELARVNIPITSVKAYSKLNNNSPNGTLLKFWYGGGGKIIKISSQLGTYGVHDIYQLKS